MCACMLKQEGTQTLTHHTMEEKGGEGTRDDDRFSRKVIQGLCGWSCASLAKCKKFFPPLVSSSSSTEKLHFLSRQGGMGCVEVNSSTYAIPSPATVNSWVKATSKSFTFHFKAYGTLVFEILQYTKVYILPRRLIFSL